MILQFDPNSDQRCKTFSTAGSYPAAIRKIAIVKGGDESKGQLMIAADAASPIRPESVAAAPFWDWVVKALKPGNTNLSMWQVNAKGLTAKAHWR